jgi:hypothetical protein
MVDEQNVSGTPPPAGGMPSGAPATPPPPVAPSSAPVGPTPSKGFVGDWVNYLKGNAGTMVAVSKNPAYLAPALGLYALAQAAMVVSQWMSVSSANKLAAEYGLGDSFVEYGAVDMITQGVFGFVSGLIMMALLYFVTTKVFKAGLNVDIKGFLTAYCFGVSPTILIIVPVVGLVAAIWALVLFFKMMKAVMGLGFWKAVGAAIVAGIAFGLIVGPASSALGVSSGYSFDFSVGDVSY